MNRTPLQVAACPEPIDQASESVLIPKSQPQDQTGKPPASPLPEGPDEEDEAADPVGDGHSDAELAERLSQERKANPVDQTTDGRP